ncbi:MAG: AraC family transcriptional regulator [Bacteroidales bacterium]|nr:AraC family transcriptional regulator [Bacteroidales bacterium]
MNSFIHQNTLPIFNTDKVDSMQTLGDYFQLAEFHINPNAFPEYFRTDYYVVEILLEGEMHCSINLHYMYAKAPCVIILLPDFVLHVDSVSDNCNALILAHDTKFADDLQMNDYSYRAKQAVRAYPCNELKESQLHTTVHYFRLLQNVLEEQEHNPNVRDCVLKLTSSLFHYLQGCFVELYQRQSAYSRAEQLTADFFGLAEQNCLKHRNIAWYAEQLCIAPKYLANVIKKTTAKPVGTWLDGYILLKAKTLLTTTSLTIQQIADTLGFKNQSHFGTFFRRATGVGPKKYRESCWRNERVGGRACK